MQSAFKCCKYTAHTLNEFRFTLHLSKFQEQMLKYSKKALSADTELVK